MKKVLVALAVFFSLAAFGATASAATCGAKFMKDPCPVDGYSVVNTERFVRGRHNWMHDIHHFGEKKRVVRRKRTIRKKRVQRKRHYKYVRRCRTVKVRR